MNKRNRHARQGHSELTPSDSIHLGPGERIRLEEIPIEDAGGDKQVGNRLYNDQRYLIASKNQSLRLIYSGTLIFTSPTVGTVTGTIWLENYLERTFSGNLTFAGPTTGTARRWDIVETVPGQSSLAVKTAGAAENPVKLMPTLGSLMVFEVLWDVNGVVFINTGEGQSSFIDYKYKTATPGPSINTHACIWRQKPVANNTYLYKLDYLEFSSGVYDEYPPRNGKLHLSFVMGLDNLIASDRIQFYTDTQGSAEGDFVLIQNVAGELELYHRRNSFWPQLEFRVTINYSTVYPNSFLDRAVHASIDLTGGYLSQPQANGGIGQTPIKQVFVYGASNVFSLSHPDPTPIYVTLNGQVLEQGSTYDWTISGMNLTVTTPLRAGDEISILYYTELPSITNYGRNIDGGVPDSVYLAIQNVDGGTP